MFLIIFVSCNYSTMYQQIINIIMFKLIDRPKGLGSLQKPIIKQLKKQKKVTEGIESKRLNTQKSTQNLKNLYKKKQESYKQHIMILINENQQYKLKQKQLNLRVNDLYEKLKQFMSEEQINSQNIYTQQNSNTNKIGKLQSFRKIQLLHNKYRKIIEQLLISYGCTKNEANIDYIRNEIELIDFLIKIFNEKAQDLKNYEISTRQKITIQQQQTIKIRQTIKVLNETNQIYRMKQNTYKEKIDELKKQKLQVCQKLAKKQIQVQRLENQLFIIRKKLSDKQNQNQKIISNLKQQNYHLKQQYHQIKNKFNQLININSQNQLKYRNLYTDYQQSTNITQDIKLKYKLASQDIQRLERQVIRWKQRYQWLEKQRLENQKKSIQQSPKYRQYQFKQKKEQNNVLKNQKDYVTLSPYSSSRPNNYSGNYGQYPEDYYNNSKNKILQNKIKKIQMQLLGQNNKTEQSFQVIQNYCIQTNNDQITHYHQKIDK